MQAVDDQEQKETIHLYVVREEDTRPSLAPVLCVVLLLLCLVAYGIVTSYQQPEVRTTLHVPAVFLPLKAFTVSVKITPTGRQTHQAIPAHGELTVYNGSILQQALPAGMIFTAQGVEVVTDTPSIVPASNPPDFGIATVAAHAIKGGAQGNIPSLAINQVYGVSLYIRNLHAFTSGQDAYTTISTTTADRATARDAARTRLTAQTSGGLLFHPCTETVTGSQTLQVRWQCQFVTYSIPSFIHVIHAQVQGAFVLLDVLFVVRPERIETK